MPDFTSALYLGLTHASQSLAGWQQLTLGQPAALQNPPGAGQLAVDLARLQGMEQSVLLPSTLHLFLDLFEVFAQAGSAIYIDSASYPIARWGAERAALRGVPLATFNAHNPRDLARQLAMGERRGLWPLVVADGVCPATGLVAPLAEYLTLVRRYRGLLVVDDTQALGLLGQYPAATTPYGIGGGGSLQHLGLSGGDILVGASLAKALGAPLAVLAGSAVHIQHFNFASLSRVHSSPPSVAVIQAAGRALAVNTRYGEQLREQLLINLRHFRKGLSNLGLAAEGGLFPVQTLTCLPELPAPILHQALWRREVKTLLLKPRGGSLARLGVVITASHSLCDIDTCLGHLDAVMRYQGRNHRASNLRTMR